MTFLQCKLLLYYHVYILDQIQHFFNNLKSDIFSDNSDKIHDFLDSLEN
jgi:hypothetical protein